MGIIKYYYALSFAYNGALYLHKIEASPVLGKASKVRRIYSAACTGMEMQPAGHLAAHLPQRVHLSGSITAKPFVT